MKRFLIGLGILLVVLAITAGAVFYTAFGSNRPIVDGQSLGSGVQIVKNGFVSVAIIDVDAGKVALIDTGNDKAGKAILAALAQRGLNANSVSAIFLTHGHQDHTAACKVFPAAQIYAQEAEVAFIGDACKVTHSMRDGEIADLGTTRVEAFATPGHTAGSAVYLARGVLFFGDSAGGGKDGSMMAAVSLFSKDPKGNVASLKSLESRLRPRAAEVKILAFAHTGPLDGFEPLAAFARAH